MTSLEGKAAFVTGASRGIGAAVARSLSAAGVSVGLASRSGDDLGLDGALGLACDVREPAAVDAAVAATVEQFGRLDILVVNAGVGAYGPFLDLSPEHLEEMIDVNLKGTLYAVRAALPHLFESAKAGSAAGKAGDARPENRGATGAKAGSAAGKAGDARPENRGATGAKAGSAAGKAGDARPENRGATGAPGADIVTLASEAGRRGLPYEAVYCASKFGQVGFTRALDHELRERGVRCTNVCPGGVATDFALDDGRGRTPDALPGMMSAEDVAEVVMFVVTRPRNHRILETALRPMTETSWG